MKRSPHLKKIEEIMRSDIIVADGFLGNDSRTLEDIIDADAAALQAAGIEAAQLAEKMQKVSDLAAEGLGSFVSINDELEACIDDNRGMLICPWGDGARRFKTVTFVRSKTTGKEIDYSDMSIHMVGNHGFFEGRGSAFRIEPAELAELLQTVELDNE